MIKEIMLLFFAVAIIFYINHELTVSHEDVHRLIATYHGCEQYNISTPWFGKAYFSCTEYGNNLMEWRMQEMKMHSLNEMAFVGITVFAELFLAFLFVYMCSHVRGEK